MGKKRKKKKVLLSGSDPFYLSKKLRRRRYGEVSAQTSQKSQNRALVKKKVAYRAPAAQACTPPTWTINRIFSKSGILAESLYRTQKTKKKTNKRRVSKMSVDYIRPSLLHPLFYVSLHRFICPKKTFYNASCVYLRLEFFFFTQITRAFAIAIVFS